MKPFAILPVLLLLTACDQNVAAAHKDTLPTPAEGRTMSCVVGGVKLAGSGDPEVGIAGFGIHGDALSAFGLNLNVERDGKVHEVSSSLMNLPMHPGTYQYPSMEQPGMTLAAYTLKGTDSDAVKVYNGGTYSQQFSAVENDPDAKLKVQVDKMLVSDAPQAGFKRIHTAGYFEFNGAALPDDSPSEACVSAGIARSIASVQAGKRLLPLFDAKVCGADKKHVRCDFDVEFDFIVQK